MPSLRRRFVQLGAGVLLAAASILEPIAQAQVEPEDTDPASETVSERLESAFDDELLEKMVKAGGRPSPNESDGG